MNKRGMDAMQTVGAIVVVLIVVVIVAVIFKQQATKGSQGFEQYSQQTGPESLKNCENLILGRKCLSQPDCTAAGGRQASGLFDDCAKKSLMCCEGK